MRLIVPQDNHDVAFFISFCTDKQWFRINICASITYYFLLLLSLFIIKYSWMHSIVLGFSTQSTLSLTSGLPIQLDDDTAIKISLQYGAPTLCLLWNPNWKFLRGQHFFSIQLVLLRYLLFFRETRKTTKGKSLAWYSLIHSFHADTLHCFLICMVLSVLAFQSKCAR